MFFAAGFILFFYLDIFVSFDFGIIGMIPMAYLIAAVTSFVSIVLFRAHRTVFNSRERRLNRIWILSLIVFSIVQFASNIWGIQLLGVFDTNMIKFSRSVDNTLFGISSLLLLFTILWRQKTVYYRWQLFCAFSIFIQAVLPVTVWRLMPTKVYYFYGLIQMPMLFGMLMMIDSMLKRRFGFDAIERSRRA